MKTPEFSLFTPDYPPHRGGVAAYLYGLATASEGGILVYADEKGWSWPLWPAWLPLVWRMWREGRKGRMILVSHVFPFGTAAWLAKILGGGDYAVIFHGLDIRLALTGWKRWLLRRICDGASRCFVNSRATQHALRTKIGTRADGAAVLYPAIPATRNATIVAFRVHGEHDILILSIARLIPRKGLDYAIQAIGGIQNNIRQGSDLRETKYDDRRISTIGRRDGADHDSVQIRYVIIGEGDDKGRLERIAEEIGVNVEFLGEVGDEVKQNYLRDADIFLLPARDEEDDMEGFGIVFLEAAAAGVPVIAGNEGGSPEAVKDEETGILVNPRNPDEIRAAVMRLINDADLRMRMGRAGRTWARQFSWDENWQKLSTNLAPKCQAPKCQAPGEEIAVVVPCYNHANILRRTLKGLLTQTRHADEIVVVDDGSADHPERVVEEYADWLPIRVIRLDKNRGAPHARNIGAGATSGQHILFLDADALLLPDAIAKMEHTLQNNPGASFAYSDFQWGNKRFRGRPFDAETLRKRNYIHTSSLMRRAAFPGFDESLKKFQDWDLWLTMAANGRTGVWIPETLYRIEPRGKEGISRWLPRVIHWVPWEIFGVIPEEIRKYRDAERIVKSKHGLL